MSQTNEPRPRPSITTRLKEVGIAVPIVKVEYDEGVIVAVNYFNPNKDVNVDLIQMFDILEIRKVINIDNKTCVQLVIDGYLSEGDKVSEVAEPENGEEQESPEGEESPESESGPEGEEGASEGESE